MTRSTARELAIHFTFELAFSTLKADQILAEQLTPEFFEARSEEEELYKEFPQGATRDYIVSMVRGVADHFAELDGYIERHAKGWKFARIDRVAAAIMRVTMYEILYMPEVPNKVAINEAVESAKKYLDEDVVRFINGILGAFVREEFPEEQ